MKKALILLPVEFPLIIFGLDVVPKSVGEVSEEKVVEDILESEPFMNQARSTRLSWQHLPTRVKGLFPG